MSEVIVQESGKNIKRKTPELLNNLFTYQSGGLPMDFQNSVSGVENVIHEYVVESSGKYQFSANVRAYLEGYQLDVGSGLWKAVLRVNGDDIIQTVGGKTEHSSIGENADNTSSLSILKDVVNGDVVTLSVVQFDSNGDDVTIKNNVDGLSYFYAMKVGGYE